LSIELDVTMLSSFLASEHISLKHSYFSEGDGEAINVSIRKENL